MTELAEILTAQIAATGPIGIADYMAICLWHPTQGYYATRHPLGRRGDFVTAPEISQMFGELLGLALAQAWLDQGAPARIVLAELGPGRGTLMADALRATARVPGFAAAAEVHLVERSPVLRAEQAARLPGATWHDSAETLPEAPLFVVANEFFDALPIRQFLRDGDAWRERLVGLRGGALTFGLSEPLPEGAVSGGFGDVAEGEMVETCPAAAPVMAAIGGRIARHGGAALIVDYGDWGSRGDTFQAVAGHRKVDPLAEPGAADLTAHVDFAALAAAAAPAVAPPLTDQGTFLDRLGIGHRARALASGLAGTDLMGHLAAHRRLTDPQEMGHLFKVLGLVAPGAPYPPGLEA